MSPTLARRTAHMIGNAHIDPVWTWCAPEGRADVRATFASVLQRLALQGHRYLARAFGMRTEVGLCQDGFGHLMATP